MSQKTMPTPNAQVVQKNALNVSESWVLYDTVLCSAEIEKVATYRDGYFTSFSAMAAASSIPFFNVRNRTHGLAYNNQDTRDQLPYVMKIYSIGVSFFSPSISTFTAASNGQQRTALDCWEAELPKHTSLTLTTNQDDRLKIATLMTPPGYGIITSGVSQGDVETAYAVPPTAKVSWTQGIPELTNKWAFRKPLEVPRRANLSVKLEISEYGRKMLESMPGPYYARLLDTGAMWSAQQAPFGIQVTIGGIREVQQRGEYSA